jgi:hypothetical protein
MGAVRSANKGESNSEIKRNQNNDEEVKDDD